MERLEAAIDDLGGTVALATQAARVDLEEWLDDRLTVIQNNGKAALGMLDRLKYKKYIDTLEGEG